MYKDKKIAVAIPCYNEESQIGKVIETMPEFVDHIVIVNDCSTDNTEKVILGYKDKYPHVELISLKKNSGVGGALAEGYKWCLQHKADVTAVMDGDGQMDPNELHNIIDPVATGRADYSKGNRLVVGDSYKKIPFVRFFGNSVLSFLTKIASGYWHVSDTQSGYTAISYNALAAIDWDNTYKSYGRPNDLLVRLNVHNFRVADVPHEPIYHIGEQSKMKIRKVVFTISWLLVKLFFFRLKEKYIIRDFHPLVFFYALGFGQAFLSMMFFIRLIFLYCLDGHIPQVTLLIFLFTSSISLQSFFFAMLFDMNANRDLKA